MSDVRSLPVGEDNEEITVALDGLAREGARRVIAMALEAEVDEYIASFAGASSMRTGIGWWCATARQGAAGDGDATGCVVSSAIHTAGR